MVVATLLYVTAAVILLAFTARLSRATALSDSRSRQFVFGAVAGLCVVVFDDLHLVWSIALVEVAIFMFAQHLYLSSHPRLSVLKRFGRREARRRYRFAAAGPLLVIASVIGWWLFPVDVPSSLLTVATSALVVALTFAMLRLLGVASA